MAEILINGKSPEEIRRIAEHCITRRCEGCEYEKEWPCLGRLVEELNAIVEIQDSQIQRMKNQLESFGVSGGLMELKRRSDIYKREAKSPDV